MAVFKGVSNSVVTSSITCLTTACAHSLGGGVHQKTLSCSNKQDKLYAFSYCGTYHIGLLLSF